MAEDPEMSPIYEGEVSAPNVVEMKDIAIVPAFTSESIARSYAAGLPPDQRLRLMAPAQKPPLLVEEARARGALAEYDMGPELAGRVRAELKLTAADGSFEISLPLLMLPYKTTEDPRLCFDIDACRAIDNENDRIEKHNKYVTSLLSLFVAQNGCGTSCNHVTLPIPPDNMASTRAARIRKIVDDKHSATLLAVRFLFERGLLCERDYPGEAAVEKANDVAFAECIARKIDKAACKVRFRIMGSRPATWDGDPDHRDSSGRRVKWERGPTHTFMSPDVRVVLARDELAKLGE